MNPPLPESNDAEARITAFLLGQLPPEEQEAVEKRIAADPKLSALANRLKKTIALLRQTAPLVEERGDLETSKNKETQQAAEAKEQQQSATVLSAGKTSLPLSECLSFPAGRRKALLARLSAPSVSQAPSQSILPWYLPLGIAACLVVALSSFLIFPGGPVKAKAKSERLSVSNTAGKSFRLLEREPVGRAEEEMRRRLYDSRDSVESNLPQTQGPAQPAVSLDALSTTGEGEVYSTMSRSPAAGGGGRLASEADADAPPRGVVSAFSSADKPAGATATKPASAPLDSDDAKTSDGMRLGHNVANRDRLERDSQPAQEPAARYYFSQNLDRTTTESAPPAAPSDAETAKTSTQQMAAEDGNARFLHESLHQTEGREREELSIRSRGRLPDSAAALGELADFENALPALEDIEASGEPPNPQAGGSTTADFLGDRFGRESMENKKKAGAEQAKPALSSRLSIAARPQPVFRGESLDVSRGDYGGYSQDDGGIGGGAQQSQEDAVSGEELFAWGFDSFGGETESLAKSPDTANQRQALDEDAWGVPNEEILNEQQFGLHVAPAKENFSLAELGDEAENVELRSLGIRPDAAALGTAVEEQWRASGWMEDSYSELAASLEAKEDRAAAKKSVPIRKQALVENKTVRRTAADEGLEERLERKDSESSWGRNQPATDNRQLRQIKRTIVRQKAADSSSFHQERSAVIHPVSTFSLNVSDVSFRLAAASLSRGMLPEPASIRPEEFFNAFSYRDPFPRSDAPIAVHTEQARFPYGHGQDVLRIAARVKSAGRARQTPLNLVILLDRSGSMERPDRQAIVRRVLEALGDSLRNADRLSLITFAREARLWADGLPGQEARQVLHSLGKLIPEGGTNLEAALAVAYATAGKHFLPHGLNRVILMTDGAANLGNTDAVALRSQVESQRRAGIALDCFGIGWDGYDDERLEALTRNGDGRYAFLNDVAQVEADFHRQLAGTLNVSAQNVKVQITFNAERVARYRQIGYARHQLAKEEFRDNTVDAAEMADAETGTALYLLTIRREGVGPIGELSLRFQDPKTKEYRELSWSIPYRESVPEMERASAAMQLATAAGMFAEWLAGIPYSQSIHLEDLRQLINRARSAYPLEPAVQQLENMVIQAQSLAGG